MGCSTEQQWEQESEKIIQQSTAMDSRYRLLNSRIDSLWDATTAHLEKKLPPDIPPIDRDIFLKARNADHIRMFKSFELLDTETQSMINAAGEYDKMLAIEARNLFEQQRKLEQVKNRFLKEVGSADEEAVRRYAHKFLNSSDAE